MEENKQKKVWVDWAAGATASLLANSLTQPLDVVKTRMIGREVIAANSIARASVFGTMSMVYKNEGLHALFRGTMPSILRAAPGSGLYFAMFRPLEYILTNGDTSKKLNSAQMFVVGSVARATAGAVVAPITVIKVRFEFAKADLMGSGVWSTMQHIYRTEGVRGLFSGLLPTLMRDVPYAGLNYTFYNQSKRLLNPALHKNELFLDPKVQVLISVLSGTTAGLLATVTTYPFDVVRTRLQLKSARYTGTVQTLKLVVHEEGLRGLFRGCLARSLKKVISGAITWTVYEQVNAALSKV